VTGGRLAGLVALVSGAASGIGRATAVLFAREGARVALGDVDLERAERAASAIVAEGGEAVALRLDVTSAEAWTAALDHVLRRWNRLDVLVNSAGIADEAPLADLTLERWRRVMAVNLDGTFLGTAAAIRAMRSHGAGAIVNVASVSGVKASPGAPAYCASKAGAIHLTRVAALECAEAGTRIRVNCVLPGGVKTPMWERTPFWPEISRSDEWTAPRNAPAAKRFAEPEEIARVIVFLASAEASYVNGAALTVDGGATI
jgi:NAD(P)-dependent dehydrogenase (short-subunit alcohol dehydrogenase family)